MRLQDTAVQAFATVLPIGNIFIHAGVRPQCPLALGRLPVQTRREQGQNYIPCRRFFRYLDWNTGSAYERCSLVVNTKVKRAAGRLLSLKLAPRCGQIGVTTECNMLNLNLLRRDGRLQNIVSF
jgi:hypothetical protein